VGVATIPVAQTMSQGRTTSQGGVTRAELIRRIEALRIEKEAIAQSATIKRMYSEAAMGLLLCSSADNPARVYQDWLRDTGEWTPLRSNQTIILAGRLGVDLETLMKPNGNKKPETLAIDLPGQRQGPATAQEESAQPKPKTRTRKSSIERKGAMPRKAREGEAEAKQILFANVEKVRQASDLTIKEVGEAISPDATFPASAWSGFKKSKVLPPMGTIRHIARMMSTSVEILLEGVNQSLIPEDGARNNKNARTKGRHTPTIKTDEQNRRPLIAIGATTARNKLVIMNLCELLARPGEIEIDDETAELMASLALKLKERG
jgi:hypothetical protein